MMQHLIDTLHSGQDSLVILHEGRQRSFGGQGLRKLYNITGTRASAWSKTRR